MAKWTEEELIKHIKVNVKDYSAAIVVSALFKKIYGHLPKIGLSGFQAENADNLNELFPD
jgi:hypothetical protein